MQINELKGVYKGQRAFLIGNGDSLNNAPFDKLQDEYTFAVNRIGKMFDKTDWRPTFYIAVSTCVIDKRFADWKTDIYRAMEESEVVFMCNYLHDRLHEPYADKVIRLECHETEHIDMENARDDFWRDDLTEGVSKYGASLLAAAQIAAYLGFDPLIFIGLDGYGRGKDNFDDTYRNETQQIGEWENDAQKRAFEIVKAASQRLGFGAYLADISNGYGVFEKVSLNDLF